MGPGDDSQAERLALQRAQAGDHEAWRLLFEWHFDPVYQYCLARAGGRQDRAEDVTQQVFLTAARGIRHFRPEQAMFQAWLLGIARNHFLKLFSRETKRKWYELQLLRRNPVKQEECAAPELLVYETLARLPAHYRTVLEAKYLQGLSVREIAEARGHTVKAIESLLSRAREKFALIYRQIQD
jgi:RNA polymerase sigma-70 factor (ECF subfamily)